MSALNNAINGYAAIVDRELDAPKTVYAALAFSLAMRLSENNEELAIELLRAEWWTLHENRIVRQKPRFGRVVERED